MIGRHECARSASLLMAVAMLLLHIACVDTKPGVVVEPRCGDGVVQDPEVCDDGDLNGTTETYCNTVCGSDELLPWFEAGRWQLPVAAKWMKFNGLAFAVSNFDNDGIWVVNEIAATLERLPHGALIPSTKLIVHSAPISVEFGVDGIFWIEKPYGGNGPKMYTAKLPIVGGAPEIRELLYPFPNGEGGQIVWPAIFDRTAAAPHNILSAFMVQNAAGDVVGYREQFDAGPSPGEQQLVAIPSRDNFYGTQPIVSRLVRFFAGPTSYVVQNAAANGGFDASLQPVSRLRPVGGVATFFGRFQHMPNEFALIDAAGTVTLHSFYCDESSSEVDAVYTQLEPGTTHIRTLNLGHQFQPLFAAMPSGALVSVANNGVGKGVKRQLLFRGPSCGECNFYPPIGVAFDRTLVQVVAPYPITGWKYPKVPIVPIKGPNAEYCDRN
jgi:hypothetical protein